MKKMFPKTINNILVERSQKLVKISSTPRLDVELLLCAILKKSRSFLYTHGDKKLSLLHNLKFAHLFRKRLKGQPLAYILGTKEFWDFELKITHGVLIPRPETEVLVEAALKKISKKENLTVVDLGTGSGAIALAIAKERPKCNVIGIDQNRKALKVARQNADKLNIKNVRFEFGSWDEIKNFAPIDIIVSNPPYIEENDTCLKKAPLKFEPIKTLASGEDGLDAIREIISLAKKSLHKNGWLILEHGALQSAKVRDLFRKHDFHYINSIQDLAKLERVSLAQKEADQNR